VYPPIENYTAGGSEASPHSLPWHVSIQYEEQHICAGTLIDDQHILTAARCFNKSFIHIPYSVVLGAHLLSNSNRRISVDRLIFHYDYNDATSENDIGLIRLHEPITSFSDHIRPACLSRSFQQSYASNPLIVAGWRKMQDNTWSVSNTDELRQTILTEMDECSDVYTNYNFKKQVCAGWKNARRNLCQGDPGSGLFEKQKYDTYRWILIGIVSYGCEHASKGYPGVYIRVSAYNDWIQNTIKQMK
jgi:trypsin